MSFSKTESIKQHLSGGKHFPPILKCLSTGPTLMNKVNYNYYYPNIESVYYYILLILLLDCLLLFLIFTIIITVIYYYYFMSGFNRFCSLPVQNGRIASKFYKERTLLCELNNESTNLVP